LNLCVEALLDQLFRRTSLPARWLVTAVRD
jgi:hypothetical protein